MFLVLSFGATFLWLKIGLPFFYPELIEQQARKQTATQQAADKTSEDPAKETPGGPSNGTQAAGAGTSDTPRELEKLPEYPSRLITLGSLDPNASTFMQVELNSRGAAVAGLRLNDRRYRELTNRALPLQLLGETNWQDTLSFDLRIQAIDQLLKPHRVSLDTVNWNVEEGTLTDRRVTFQYPSPDGRFQLLKTYELLEGDPKKRDTDSNGYCLNVTLGFRNLTGQPLPLTYELQGPVGFPLEDLENTRRFLTLQAGFLRSGSVRHEHLTAKEIAAQVTSKGRAESLQSPVRYVGIDGQYFATLLVPRENQADQPWIVETQPQLTEPAEQKDASRISLAVLSAPLEIPSGQTVEHGYTLFAGPKRTALLRPFGAEAIIEYGWFGAISKIMLAIMNFFHRTLYLPYGLAIIMLTVIVRGAMYPISRKHALAAKKMKEMQPRFEEIRKKYENDKEKLAKAQMELMKESGFFSGCLPMLLQLPIFIGLYQALYVSVDLRMAEFLWIENLAAPDRLFRMPFSIPFLGYDFNLLPMITVALFVVQQKLFAPPPANEEQALQQKMMSYMMIVIGVMFYRVPAGLCVYFIASSLWAIAERKILDFHDTAATSAKQKKEQSETRLAPGAAVPARTRQPSWLQKLMSQLDAAANPTNKGAQEKKKN